MEISEVDGELLELLALQSAWYMVCGEFYEAYGSPGALASRLFELRAAGLIEIHARAANAELSAAALEADAINNDCYRDLSATNEPRWDLVATDAGFQMIKGRLSEQ